VYVGIFTTEADINWKIWATVVAEKYTMNEYERAIEAGPPSSLVGLFSHFPETEQQHVSQLQRSYSFSRESLLQIQERLQGLEELSRQRRMQIEMQREAQDRTDQHFSQQLNNLVETVQRELRLVDAFGVSVGPVETEESRNAYNSIPNQEDVDHGIW
jgi:hypothetical protein